MSARLSRDPGLVAGPVQAGDVLEAGCHVVRVGDRSRELPCWADVVARVEPARGPSAAAVPRPPVRVVEATATLVVPASS